ncbi:sigma-70 family RNA polymerase sigma factor [Kitasatospora cinereorecta]|uniref:Sigma-70 family RNA polymerase sigma factor n=1 Tax=Kitasatospora cinereorecta TaxID=285560 RepID=A0ABW0VH72_9ACTN
MESERTAALVGQAQHGDRQATAELISGHLPLVYNIVGRALAGHADTDDVVQDTMLRAVDGLGGLRDPRTFRSWLVAIAMNQIRRRHRDTPPTAPGDDLNSAYGVPDPGSDFVGLTIVRLGLSEQRREVAEATRWLDPGDQDLLSLWWQEAAGELSRAELADAMEIAPAHAAVRVQRMKAQLEAARVVVRALAVTPRCPWLAELTASWDGEPSALWRKRIGRHAKECGACARHRNGLVPAEGLLAGLAMVPLPDSLGHPLLANLLSGGSGGSGGAGGHGGTGGGHGGTGGPGSHAPATHTPASHAPGSGSGGPRPSSHRGGGGRRRAVPRGRKPLTVAGAAVVTAVVAGVVATGLPDKAPKPDTAPPAKVEVASAVQDSPSPSPSDSPTPSPTPTPTPTPSPTTAAPKTSSAAPKSVQLQVIDLVNAERTRNGCKPVKSNDKLQLAAQRHSDDMAARNFFDHTNPDGAGPQERIDATGYRWSSWGENIARGQQGASSVMTSWMNSPGHRANILNCSFTELGVGVHNGAGGPWWTQDFGTPG